jgi:hypothetical protein
MEDSRRPSLCARAFAAAVLVFAGCRTVPEPPPPILVPPDRTVQPRQFTGSPMEGFLNGNRKTSPPAAAAAGVPSEPRLRVKIDLIAVDKLQAAGGGALDPLASHARLILAPRGANPILASPRLLAGSRVGASGALGDSLLGKGSHASFIGSFTGLLASGETWALDAGDAARRPALPGGESAWRHLELLVHLPAASQPPPPPDQPRGLEVAIAREEEGVPVEPPSTTEEPGGLESGAGGSAPAPVRAAPPAKEIQREAVLLAGLPEKVPGQFSLLLPFRFDGGSSDWVYARVTIDEAPPGFKAPLIESSVATARTAYKEAPGGEARSGAGGAEAADLELKAALGSLNTGYLRRRALTFLAARTGADLCEDLALAAGDDVLTQLAARVGEETSAAGAVITPAALGFTLEKTALTVLAGLLNDETIPGELKALLVSHAGEAGRDPATIEEVLHASTSKEDLDRRLIDENMICLDDSSPSSRVRALDWLRSRSRAPEGYDPMAPVKERRKALEKAQSPKEETKVMTEGKAR